MPPSLRGGCFRILFCGYVCGVPAIAAASLMISWFEVAGAIICLLFCDYMWYSFGNSEWSTFSHAWKTIILPVGRKTKISTQTTSSCAPPPIPPAFCVDFRILREKCKTLYPNDVQGPPGTACWLRRGELETETNTTAVDRIPPPPCALLCSVACCFVGHVMLGQYPHRRSSKFGAKAFQATCTL